MAIKTVLNTDIKKKVDVKPFPGYLFSGDANANEITVKITDDGVPASLSGSVHGYVIRKDHKTVVIDGELNEAGDEATIILPNSAYSVPGQVSIVIKVGTTTVGACRAIVYESTTMPIVDPGEIVPDISELLAVIADCEEATDEAENVNITSSKSDGIITIVTTDRTGTQTTSTVHDTEIDDSKDIGDTVYVWSADKDAKELYKKAPVIEPVIDTPAPIVSFSDGADDMPMEVTVGIEASQDLHGYEYPWAGGNGKNLFGDEEADWLNGYRISTDGSIVSSSASSYKISQTHFHVPEQTEMTAQVTLLSIPGGYCRIGFYASDDTAVGAEVIYLANITEAGKKSVTFTTPENTEYIRICIAKAEGVYEGIQVEIGSTATEYEPYSNLCPISGHSETTITHNGKNLVDWDNITFISGYLINASGEIVEHSSYKYTENYMPIDGGKEITVSIIMPGNNTGLTIAFYDSNKNFIERVTASAASTSGGYRTSTFVTPSTARYYRFSISSTATSDRQLMIEYGSTATEYAPFYNNVINVTFPSDIGDAGVVYGGTLTVNKDGTGTLVITHWKTKISSWTWTYASNYGFRAGSNHTSIMPVNGGQKYGQAYCTAYRISNVTTASSFKALNGVISIGNTGITNYRLIVQDDKFGDDAAAFKAAMGDVEIVFEVPDALKAERTYTLTAEQIRTLLGVNRISCDTGNVLKVSYFAGTKIYIDQKNEEQDNAITDINGMIADSEASMIATKNYSAGELFTVQNKLYKTTASIASGETFVPGVSGNCTKTTIASEISAILDSSATGVTF